MYLKAALKFKNLVYLALGAALAFGTRNVVHGIPWLSAACATAGAAAYAAAVILTVNSRQFQEEYKLTEKLDDIHKLSWECNSLHRKISGRLDKTLRTKAIGILKQKQELINYLDRYCEDPIRQRIIEQALKLVIAYFNLAGNYSDRMRELSQQNMNSLISRINQNNRKLGSLKSYEAVLELTKTVEMDEKLLQSFKDDRRELEMISVRLDQIECAIVGFKHRILSTDLSDPETEEIENVINEASALDNALNEHVRLRRKI